VGGDIVNRPDRGANRQECALKLFHTLALALLWAAPAAAHPGHIADVAGHDHWIAGVAIGAAIAAAAWGWLKGRKQDAETAQSDDADDTAEQAA
jgi:hypothetical protein